jgi:hypothetical protein
LTSSPSPASLLLGRLGRTTNPSTAAPTSPPLEWLTGDPTEREEGGGGVLFHVGGGPINLKLISGERICIPRLDPALAGVRGAAPVPRAAVAWLAAGLRYAGGTGARGPATVRTRCLWPRFVAAWLG